MSSEPSVSLSHPGDDESYSGWVGRVVDGRYRIDRLLGEGGMGAVFEAEHLKLIKKVALKVIHPEFAGDGEIAERFAREAMASAQMDHPHIAGAMDYGTLPEGGAYLVMQYVRGDSLRDVIDAEGAVAWLRACQIGAQVADALAEAHKNRIVHRDLKPDNVMLEPRDDGTVLVKVLDFGIARVADEKIASGGPALTRIGTVIGTPGYMAPEQALGEPVDERVDIYALGLLLHEMVTGKRLFDIDDLTAIVTRQLTQEPPRIAAQVEGVPEELDDLVARMLAKDKSARPSAATEVRETLRQMMLSATMQLVKSGEHALPNLSTAELSGAMREPTPLRVATQAPTTGAIGPAVAPTMMAASPAPSVRRPNVPERPRRATGVATARTALALEQVKEVSARAQELTKDVPLPAKLAGLGCAALLALSVLVGVPVLLFGGDDPPALVKTEHDAPLPPPVEEDPPEASPPPASARSVPTALAQAQFDLTEAREATRRRAANQILEHTPREEVPPFLIALAELEIARRCENMKEQVLALEQLGDARALAVLQRLADEPRNGCGNVFRRTDCYWCMRTELERTITSLSSE